MWEFLNNLLEKAGFVAVVYAVTIGALGLTVRALWKRLEAKESERAALAAQLAAATAERAAAIEAVRHEETERRSRMREALDAQLMQIAEERRAETRAFSDRLDTLQERRVKDAQDVMREAVEHIAETRQSVDKITHAMQTLERVLHRGG